MRRPSYMAMRHRPHAQTGLTRAPTGRGLFSYPRHSASLARVEDLATHEHSHESKVQQDFRIFSASYSSELRLHVTAPAPEALLDAFNPAAQLAHDVERSLERHLAGIEPTQETAPKRFAPRRAVLVVRATVFIALGSKDRTRQPEHNLPVFLQQRQLPPLGPVDLLAADGDSPEDSPPAASAARQAEVRASGFHFGGNRDHARSLQRDEIRFTNRGGEDRLDGAPATSEGQLVESAHLEAHQIDGERRLDVKPMQGVRIVSTVNRSGHRGERDLERARHGAVRLGGVVLDPSSDPSERANRPSEVLSESAARAGHFIVNDLRRYPAAKCTVGPGVTADDVTTGREIAGHGPGHTRGRTVPLVPSQEASRNHEPAAQTMALEQRSGELCVIANPIIEGEDDPGARPRPRVPEKRKELVLAETIEAVAEVLELPAQPVERAPGRAVIADRIDHVGRTRRFVEREKPATREQPRQGHLDPPWRAPHIERHRRVPCSLHACVIASWRPMARQVTPIVWQHNVERDGVIAYRMGRQGRRFVAEWPKLARLTCSPEGRDARLQALAGAARRKVAKLQGVVKALLVDLQGGLGIHAAAVVVQRSAILLVGESGAGKSTTAAELCLHRGARMLADDAAVLEWRRSSMWVLPSEGCHFLSAESSNALGVRPRIFPDPGDKSSVPSVRVGSHASPLALIVRLRFDDSLRMPRLQPVAGADAARCVLGSMFRFDVNDRRDELDRVIRLYEQTPFVEIARPRSSPDVSADVLRALENTRD